eukprot:359936-Chlamydomonas_euryale.AAC.15
MLRGELPSDELLTTYQLREYRDIKDAVHSGDVALLLRCLDVNQQAFVQVGLLGRRRRRSSRLRCWIRAALSHRVAAKSLEAVAYDKAHLEQLEDSKLSLVVPPKDTFTSCKSPRPPAPVRAGWYVPAVGEASTGGVPAPVPEGCHASCRGAASQGGAGAAGCAPSRARAAGHREGHDGADVLGCQPHIPEVHQGRPVGRLSGCVRNAAQHTSLSKLHEPLHLCACSSGRRVPRN